MSDLYGTVGYTVQSTASSSWSVATPAGLTGHTQILSVAYRDKSATLTTPSGWTLVVNHPHSVAIGRLIVYSRVLVSDVSASTATLAFSAGTVGESVCADFDGIVDVSSSAAETTWVTSVAPPSLTASVASSVYYEIVVNPIYPRNANVAAPAIKLIADRVNPQETSTVHAAKKVVGAGAVSGDSFTFVNPYPPNSDDSETISWSVILKPSGGSPPPGPPPATGATITLATLIDRMQTNQGAKLLDGSDPPSATTKIRMPVNKAFWDSVYPPVGAQHNNYFDSVAPWAWAYLAQGNTASGKRIVFRACRVGVLLDSPTGSWWDSGTRIYQKVGFYGQLWAKYSPQGTAGVDALTRNEGGDSISISVTSTTGVELWCSDFYVIFGRTLAARAVDCAWTVECRVINDDGSPYTGADAKYCVNIGYDPYNSQRNTPAVAQFSSGIYPHAADGGNGTWIVVDGSMGWTKLGGIGVTGTQASFTDGAPPPFGNFGGSPSSWLGDDAPYVLTPTQLAANPPTFLVSDGGGGGGGGSAVTISSPTFTKFSAVSSASIYAPATLAANQTQVIVLAASLGSGITVSMPSGWNLREATTVDSYPNRLMTWTRTLATATATEFITATFTGGNASGIISSFLAEGTFIGSSRNTATQSNYALTLSPPTVAPSSGSATAVSIMGSSQYPRTAVPNSTAMTLRMNDWQASPSGGVSLAYGNQDVTSSSFALATWNPSDPETPGAEAGEWWRAITLLFGTTTLPGGDVTVTASGGMAFVAGPTNCTITEITKTTARVNWTDNSTDETGFSVRVHDTLTGTDVFTTFGAGVTTGVVTSLLAGRQYNVAVFAVRGSDFSAPTNIASFITQEGSSFTLTATALTVGPNGLTTITAQTSPPVVGAAVNYTWDGALLELQGSASFVTDSNGQASGTWKGLSVEGLATVTFTIEGVVRSIQIGTTFLTEDPVLKINPARLEKDASAQVIVTGDFGGRSFIGLPVSLVSSVPSVIASPANQVVYAVPGSNGEARFSLRALENGTTVLIATVDGKTSNPVTMVVEQPTAPFSIAASGVSIVSLTAESPLAVAARPRPRRLTHADLVARYPGESGLQLADVTAKTNYVFITAAQIREAG